MPQQIDKGKGIDKAMDRIAAEALRKLSRSP